jgi:very-short-patch-repair endonuclease
MPTLDDRLLPVFVRQHWLVSLHDVIAAGGTRQQAANRVASGRWLRAEVGVYRLAGPPDTWEQRLLAPLLRIGDGAVASHLAAARLHGIPGYANAIPEITMPRGRETRRAHLRLHTSNDLDRCQVVTLAGIPVTEVDRTILDLGRYVGDRRLLRAIEWARRTDQATWSSLIVTLRRHARRGRPGIQRLRRVIATNAHRTEITDSDFELMLLALLLEHGLPEPVLHHRVTVGGRFVAEVDLAYPDLEIAIEADGRIHLEEEVRERDLPRQNDLVLLGWSVLRFSWKRFVEHPDRVAAEVVAARRVALELRAA